MLPVLPYLRQQPERPDHGDRARNCDDTNVEGFLQRVWHQRVVASRFGRARAGHLPHDHYRQQRGLPSSGYGAIGTVVDDGFYVRELPVRQPQPPVRRGGGVAVPGRDTPVALHGCGLQLPDDASSAHLPQQFAKEQPELARELAALYATDFLHEHLESQFRLSLRRLKERHLREYRQERLQLVAPNSTEHALLGRNLRQMEEELNRIFKPR